MLYGQHPNLIIFNQQTLSQQTFSQRTFSHYLQGGGGV